MREIHAPPVASPARRRACARWVLEMSIDMTSDLHEHLDQLIAYARMNGVKPPWSK